MKTFGCCFRLFVFSLFTFFSGCNPTPSIIAEFHQAEESCTVVSDPDFYQKHHLDPKLNAVVKYTFFLPADRRYYLSGCGPQLGAGVPESAALEGSYPDPNNPVFLSVYYRLNADDQFSIPFTMKCLVGGLSAAGGDELRSENKALRLQKRGDGYDCSVDTDSSGTPYVSR